jgi:hypothetical protein
MDMITIEIEGIAESYDDFDYLLVDRSGEVKRVSGNTNFNDTADVEPGKYTVWLVHKIAPVVDDEQRSNGPSHSLPPGATRLELLCVQHYFENGDMSEVDVEDGWVDKKVKCRDCAKQVNKDAVSYTPHMKLPLCKECRVVHGDGVEYDHQVWFEIHGPDKQPNW